MGEEESKHSVKPTRRSEIVDFNVEVTVSPEVAETMKKQDQAPGDEVRAPQGQDRRVNMRSPTTWQPLRLLREVLAELADDTEELQE